ncbi:MAG: nickel-dependent hydrogenase large subunit [Coriobacteriales bacterium]|jgi:hydrogenase large subunit|nr:nickel-dependent hydrogenase large subunit [Coriobacteriales bacterium]
MAETTPIPGEELNNEPTVVEVLPDGEIAQPIEVVDADGNPLPASAVVPISAPAPIGFAQVSGQSIIDPVNRIEGHLRIDMEVENNVVTGAWVTGGAFRGMELVLQGRQPADAAYIAQRICGVCPVSHAHSACIAGEKSYGIEIPNTARIIRNIIEGAQFLHSHILWFYNLAALDYVNPLNALNADIADTLALANAAGTGVTDFGALKKRLAGFAENGQLSIFSGNWFDTEDKDYNLPPELDLIATAHYLEALEMQATASEISGIIGGKMPHIMSSLPGGTTFVPTEEKLDDILFRAIKIRDWVSNTMIPDTLAIVPFYLNGFSYGGGVGRYIAWGVFDDPSRDPSNRYLPAGVWGFGDSSVAVPDEKLITEHTKQSFYSDSGDPVNPRDGITEPFYPEGGADRNGKYTWDKAPRYDGKTYEAGGLSRLLVAYNKGVPEIKEGIDGLLEALGHAGEVEILKSTMGRTGARNIETLYIANKMVEWVNELIEALKGGDSTTFVQPETTTGEGAGMWEAPRGALYHYMKVTNNVIDKYQIIIPSTWNISPRDEAGLGPMEQALVGVPVNDLEKPIHALRTVHSFDPCTACAVHISEPATGKKFSTVTNPWGVK